jgi:hypothetical protein
MNSARARKDFVPLARRARHREKSYG